MLGIQTQKKDVDVVFRSDPIARGAMFYMACPLVLSEIFTVLISNHSGQPM